MKLFVCLIISCAIALAQFPEPSGGSGGGGGVGAVNASATCAGATTSCAVTITSLNLTTMNPALIQCKTASAIVAITGYSTTGSNPITTVTPTYSSTSNVTCTVNSNGGAGAAGAAGADGADGADGAAATIAVGTVTTGSAGSSATVTNSGTSSAAVFDFSIPRGADGAGSGDVVGPSSAVDNTVAIYDSTTGKLIKSGTGCTIASATLTCTGGFVSGDGTAESGIILKELAANGSNDFRVYGAASQSADGCLVFSGALGSGEAWRGSSSTVTIDGKTCRVMETYTPSAGGGSLTLSHCFLTANCANVGAPGRSAIGTINTMYMMRVTIPGSLTLAKLIGYFSSGGSSNSTVVGIFADSAGAPGTMLTDAQFRFTNLAAAAVRQVSPISGTPSISAGGTYWVGWASEDSAALMWTLNAAFTGPGMLLGAMSAKPGIVSCSNAPTGTGGTYALQTTCGTATPLTTDTIVPLFLASAY